MYKKQICKVSFTGCYGDNDYNGYGIYIGNGDILLENNKVLTEVQSGPNKGAYAKKDRLIVWDGSTYIRNTHGEVVKDAKISATRNVPEDIRAAMETAGVSAIKMLQMAEKFEKIKSEYTGKMESELEVIKSIPEKIRNAKGTLSEQEFVDYFLRSLSPTVKSSMQSSSQRGYYGSDGNWGAKIYSNNLIISRSVLIDKCTPSFTYLEYDDTRMMCDDAEKNPEYKRYMNDYSKKLPVKGTISEYLDIGDKNSLSYYGSYSIKLNPKKALTKDYAKELADKFCGVERNKEVDLDEELER